MALVAGYETIPLRDACEVTAGPSGALWTICTTAPTAYRSSRRPTSPISTPSMPGGCAGYRETRPRSCPGSNFVRATSCMSARAQSAVSRSFGGASRMALHFRVPAVETARDGCACPLTSRRSSPTSQRGTPCSARPSRARCPH